MIQQQLNGQISQKVIAKDMIYSFGQFNQTLGIHTLFFFSLLVSQSYV